MSCPRCGTEPAPGDRFCRECGGYLATTSFDDLEPPGSAPQDDEPPGYVTLDTVQFSGPAVPAIEDEPEPPSYADHPTMTGWDPPTPQSWFDEAPQYEAPPYQSGGAAPFEPPRYDRPDYAREQEPRDKRRRGALIVGIGALAVILLASVGAIAVFGDRGDDAAGADGSSSPVATSSSSPSADTPDAQAKAVDDLLSKAAGGKNMLATAYEKANACEISPAEAEKRFEAAAKNRRGIVTSARKLDTSKIDNGPRIKSLLISMYNTSAKADDAFASWARAGDRNGDSCLVKNAKRTKGNKLSVKAGKAKKRFVKAWNPVAEQYGHTKRTKNGL